MLLRRLACPFDLRCSRSFAQTNQTRNRYELKPNAGVDIPLDDDAPPDDSVLAALLKIEAENTLASVSELTYVNIGRTALEHLATCDTANAIEASWRTLAMRQTIEGVRRSDCPSVLRWEDVQFSLRFQKVCRILWRRALAQHTPKHSCGPQLEPSQLYHGPTFHALVQE